MVADARRPPPPGLRRREHARGGWLPDVLVRCRRQDPDEKPLFARPRLSSDVREFSGALGDLGTLLPYLLGAVVVVGMPAVGVLFGFGLFMIAAGLFFAVPLAVQPMKAVGAAMVALPMTAGAVTASGLLIGFFFLLTSLTGILNWLARLIGPRVASGLQLGLALLLALSALPLLKGAAVFGGVTLLALLLLMWRAPRLPAALIVLPLATLLFWAFQGFPELPALSLTFALPALQLPAGDAWLEGLLQGALPQIPLTLANAIIVTAALARRYYPNELHPVSERKLGISTGLGNLLTAPFGAMPMCHGAGGLAAQHRLGARSGTAPVALGLLLLACGLLLGEQSAVMLQSIPEAVLGALLLLAAFELARASNAQQLRGQPLLVLLATAAVALVGQLAIALLAGLLLDRLFCKEKLS